MPIVPVPMVEHPEPGDSGSGSAARRVLLIDDAPDVRKLVRFLLEEAGMEVVGEAGDGASGIEAATRLQPDVIVLDLAMPVPDGLEALPSLRAAVPEARVVILTVSPGATLERQLIRSAGADAYVVKGGPPEELVSAISTATPAGIPQQPGHDSGPTVQHSGLRPGGPEADTVAALRVELARTQDHLEQIVYLASHDLAEPLNVITGFAELLARRYAGAGEAEEFCRFVLDGAGRMRDLLDDLLEYARAGHGDVDVTVLHSAEVLEDVKAALASRIQQSGAVITVSAMPETIVASRIVLTQVLQNLVSNALKFTRPGEVPQVEVSAQRSDNGWQFSVRDEGIGVDPLHAERIFEPFKRLHSRDAYEGNGIGLAICRRLLERVGGTIWLEPNDEGGSTFHVNLPDLAECPDD